MLLQWVLNIYDWIECLDIINEKLFFVSKLISLTGFQV